jgi:hypothetical protein
MSQHQAFRRVPVNPQAAQQYQVTTLPAPTRGLVLDENQTFMQPGAAVVLDNWKPTLRGISLRGGCILHSDLHALDKNQAVWDFAGWDRALWDHVTGSPPTRKPVISGFSYVKSNNQKIFAANANRLIDVTAAVTEADPTLVREGHNSGNYVFSQLSNQGGDWGLAINEAGDFPLRFNGTSWVELDGTAPASWANGIAYAVDARAMDADDRSYWKCVVGHTSAATGTFSDDRIAHPSYWTPDQAADGSSWITGPEGSTVESGGNLTYVCKYHDRYFFIEGGSMNAWYLPTNAVGGLLKMIPLSGAATKGGRLLFCAVWSLDAGNGLDDKLVFATDLGELLIFSGSDPSTVASWRQEGRYSIPAPLGMNAHMPIGGDLLIATVDGIVPVSASINKTPADLELAAITRNIRPMWRDEVTAKRAWSWTMINWEEYGGIFVATPGSKPGYCLTVNAATGAWARFVGYDATCFMRLRGDLYFGTQDGRIMLADRTGYDDGKPYLATMVGGWEMFQSPSQTVTWRQARVNFAAVAGQPFQPQITAATDYVVTLPAAPPAGTDPGTEDLWDQGSWDQAKWDQTAHQQPVVRNTLWVSIGATGFSHAPIVQVTVAQKAKPNVDLISIGAVFERCGVNV